MLAKFVAPNIECEGCAASINKALRQAPGVRDVQVDISVKSVSIDFDPKLVNIDSLSETLNEIGFPVK